MSDCKLKFREELRLQRWDDHRYYHQSRINQALHLLSACCFIGCYAMMFVNPGIAVLLGWVVAMLLRQAGHFFFEPRDYDTVNRATHEHKESIKVGYNLHRKRMLHLAWAIVPALLLASPTFFGAFEAYATPGQFWQNLAILWLWLAVGALLFRTVHLFFIENVQTGLVWATKILTDPFNDFRTYCKSPVYLFRGELIDPMVHVVNELDASADEPDAIA